jgi:hypothetical protein
MGTAHAELKRKELRRTVFALTADCSLAHMLAGYSNDQ